MSKTQHTPEPWTDEHIENHEGCGCCTTAFTLADQERIIQCVNALAGIDDPEAHLLKLRRAVQLLRDLADLQNGAPLVTEQDKWRQVMGEAYSLLEELE
jgi:hypothetical protein